jgi:TPP-dependent pyruvate/acetoin dehydrogenase alpha subunit
MDNKSLFRSLYRIRRFEETVLEEFPRGRFYGTTHTYLGQEANAVGVLSWLQPGDVVVSNHRCHGHFLAYGGDMHALFAELMGKASGVCGGRGGSQHLHWRNFYSNGILAGTLPVATGMAMAEKLRNSGKMVVTFLGDGAMGEGILYEALNMASLWAAPILYVVENNRIAQTTPIELNLAGDIGARFAAFGIPHEELDSSDVLEILPLAKKKIEAVRSQDSPQALILNTHRFGPHSKGDDTRNPQEMARWREERDPVQIHGVRLSKEERSAIGAEVSAEVDGAFQQALQDPLPALDEALRAPGQSPSANPKS